MIFMTFIFYLSFTSYELFCSSNGSQVFLLLQTWLNVEHPFVDLKCFAWKILETACLGPSCPEVYDQNSEDLEKKVWFINAVKVYKATTECCGISRQVVFVTGEINILVWTQRVKPGFMHALGNTPTLNLVLRGSLDHRTVSRSVGSQNGADPGSLGLSGAPDTGPWTP